MNKWIHELERWLSDATGFVRAAFIIPFALRLLVILSGLIKPLFYDYVLSFASFKYGFIDLAHCEFKALFPGVFPSLSLVNPALF